MIWVTSWAVSASPVATKSGSAIGIGWICPGGGGGGGAPPAAGRANPAGAPAAPAPSRMAPRRVNKPWLDVELCWVIGSSSRRSPDGLNSIAHHLGIGGIEGDLQVLPCVVVLRIEHGVGLASDHRPFRAVARRNKQRGVAAAGEHHRGAGKCAIRIELKLNIEGHFLVIPHTGGRIPHFPKPCAERHFFTVG